MSIAIPTVHVVSFVKPMRTGANEPWLTLCKDEHDNRDEYVVKFHGVLHRNIIKEYAAAYLAACLNVRTAPAAFIEVPEKLVQNIHDTALRQKLEAKPNPHWGTKYLVGHKELTIDETISDGMISNKIRLFAFDMLIQNFDRTTNGIGKPNILVQGDEFVAIDHDKTFSCTDFLTRSSGLEPWQLRGSHEELSHVFKTSIYRYGQSYNVSFAEFVNDLASIPNTTLDSMFNRMPPRWHDQEYEQHILYHLNKIRSNLPKFLRGLEEVFA